jgi:hypothetical protein
MMESITFGTSAKNLAVSREHRLDRGEKVPRIFYCHYRELLTPDGRQLAAPPFEGHLRGITAADRPRAVNA